LIVAPLEIAVVESIVAEIAETVSMSLGAVGRE
jgi:hypothetical protein